jgi:hypothetical protein
MKISAGNITKTEIERLRAQITELEGNTIDRWAEVT